MIKVSVLFPSTPGAGFDKGYHFAKHLPLLARLLGPALKGISIEEGTAGGMPGTPPPYVMCAHFSFESMDTYRDAFYPHAETVMRNLDAVTRLTSSRP